MLRRLTGTTMTILGLAAFGLACAGTGLYLRHRLGSAGEAGSLEARLDVARFEREVAQHENGRLRHDLEHVTDRVRTVERQTEVELDQVERLRAARCGFRVRGGVYRAWGDATGRTGRGVRSELEGGTFGHAALSSRREDASRAHAEAIAGMQADIDEAVAALVARTGEHARVMTEKRRIRDAAITKYNQIVHDLQVAAREREFGAFGGAPR